MSSGGSARTMSQRQLDVVERLARIAELQEEAHLDACVAQEPRRVSNLLDARALLHRIEHALRPDSAPIQTVRHPAARSARAIALA